jgi:hypothetical protein
VGLKDSEHISKILVHPENPHNILVASRGSLWTKGGDRGIFKYEDGRQT